MKKYLLLPISLLFILSGCTTQKIAVYQNNVPEYMGVHLTNYGRIADEAFYRYVDQTKKYIEDFNMQDHHFNLYFSEKDSNSVNIDFVSNVYVTPGKQALGVVVTGLGIATFIVTIANPALGFYAIFWYTPMNNTVINVTFSRSIDPYMLDYTRNFTTGHQFQKYEKQVEKQTEEYYKYLDQIMKEIEMNFK